MFCPKCGTENPDTGKYCRSCGTDLAPVSAALSGKLPAQFSETGRGARHLRRLKRRDSPNEVFGDAVKSILSGVGFVIISVVLFLTGVAGGHAWWWALLFPAFFSLARGVSDVIKYGMMKGEQDELAGKTQKTLNQPRTNAALPPTQTEYVAPESRYKTGDLVPPSVTEPTTRLLEMDPEGETRTLPKK